MFTTNLIRSTFMALLLPAAIASANPGHTPAPDWEKTATLWSSGDYTYDAAGNVIAIGTDVYRYDALGRLVSGTAKTPGYPANLQQYTYDRYGNLLTVTTSNEGGSGQIAMAVDPLTNQLDGTCPPNVPCMTGAYDQSGNQTGLMPNDGLYRWDDLGMMTQISAPGRMQRYLYDADGERIAALTIDANGNVVKARYTLRGSDHKVARELVHDRVTNTWTRTRDHVYRAGTLMAVFDGTSTSSAADRHYHVDHLGTPRMVSDRGGTTQALHTYWPFGQEAPGSDRTGDADRLRFTGHERDAAEFESDGAAPQPGWDLDYMHARYYNPNGGRFLSVDPIIDVKKALRSPQMWNGYSYVMNNPLLYIDPTGKVTVTIEGVESDLKARKLVHERDSLVKYAQTLAAQVKAGVLDSKKAVDMYWAKAQALTGADKQNSRDREGATSNALLIATSAALVIRGPIGNNLTRPGMGEDTLHHFFLNAYNSQGGVPGYVQSFGSNVVLPSLLDGRLTVEDDTRDRRANVRGARFGVLLDSGQYDTRPSQVTCPRTQAAVCQ